MKLRLFLIITVTLIFLNKANAQTDTTSITQTKLALSQQLIDMTGAVSLRYASMRSEWIKSIGSAAHIPEKNRPKFEAEMAAYLDKYQPIETYKKTFLNLYAQEFTEQELKQLIDFYNSPIGKKIIVVLPGIMQKAMLISQNSFKDHFDEIQAIAVDAMKE